MIDTIIEIIKEKYPLTKVDVGQAGAFSAAGMKFTTTHYDANKLGSVSVMEANGFLGLMQMRSVIVNPFSVDAPLFSYDSIKAFGSTKVFIEIFDTTLGHAFDIERIESLAKEGKKIPEEAFTPHWYDDLRLGTPQCKKVNAKNKESFNEWAKDYFDAYMEACAKAPECDEDEKRRKAAVYSDGLLANGGPATDPVKKALGDEKAGYFFKHVLFATER